METSDRDAQIDGLKAKLIELRQANKSIKQSYAQVVNQLTASPSTARPHSEDARRTKPSDGLASLKEGNVRNIPEKSRLQIQRDAAGPAIPGRPLLSHPELDEGPDGGNPAIKARQSEVSACQQ